jgi:hypothetical protein
MGSGYIAASPLCQHRHVIGDLRIFPYTNLWHENLKFKAANKKLATGQKLLSVFSTLETESEGSAFVEHHTPPLDNTPSRVNPQNTFPQNSFKNYPPFSSSIFTYLIKMCKIHA